MENFKKTTYLSILFLLGILSFSCVQDDDYSIPEINVENPVVTVGTTIGLVKEIYRGYEPKIIEAGIGSNKELFLEAFVVSSDESGNFYKTLVIQDASENPTAGVALSTNATNLYTKFEPGRKIYFRVDGLYIGEYAGLPTIGIQDGDAIGRMDIQDFESRIVRTATVDSLIAQTVTIAQATDKTTNGPFLNTLVKFENVQFVDEIAGMVSYADPKTTFGINRNVVNCEDEKIILRTSGFASFKGIILPEGNGTLTAILSTFNGDAQVFIRDTYDVKMSGERCN